MAEYEIFVAGESQLEDGEEQTVDVRTKGTSEAKKVRAIISSKAETLPGADVLWLRWRVGTPVAKPWAIKILEEITTPEDLELDKWGK